MDIEYLLLLQNLREITGGVFNQFLLFITHFGENEYLIPIIAFTFWCMNKKLGQKMLFTFGFSGLINGLLKLLACVYRPWIRDERVVPLNGAKTTATGYSFPSGHSTNAASVFGSLGYHFRKDKSLFRSFLLMILLVMLSRNYLGVHTPQDVLVGCLTGLCVVFLMEKLLAWEEKKQGRDLYIVLAGIAVTLLILAVIFTKSYPVDYDASGNILVDYRIMRIDSLKSAGLFIGILLGWFFEKRYIHFETPTGVKNILAVCVPGILLLYLFMFVIESLLVVCLGKVVGYILGEALLALFITVAYPWWIAKTEHKKQTEKITVLNDNKLKV